MTIIAQTDKYYKQEMADLQTEIIALGAKRRALWADTIERISDELAENGLNPRSATRVAAKRAGVTESSIRAVMFRGTKKPSA